MPPSPPPFAPAVPEPAADSHAAASLDSLPDDLLGRIMALVGKKHGASLTLVSHRWRHLFFAEPSLWRSFQPRLAAVDEFARPLLPADQRRLLEQQLATLRRVAPHVQRFSWVVPPPFDDGLDWHLLEEFLAPSLMALVPGQLAELQLGILHGIALSEAAVAGLRRLAGVPSLALVAEEDEPVTAALAALGSQLYSLQLRPTFARYRPAVGSIVQLPQLTCLEIAPAVEHAELGMLTRLSRLKQLVLSFAGREAQPPEPGSFPAGLERFSYRSAGGHFLLGGCHLCRCRLWHGRGSPLDFDDDVPFYPLPTLELHFWKLQPPGSLAELLAAVQPAGASQCAFQRLDLVGLDGRLVLAGCTQLRQLRQLRWRGTLHGLETASLLRLSASLSSLEVDDIRRFDPEPGTVPACLAAYHGLTSLQLRRQELEDLPSGDYLSGLRSLDLANNQFMRLPEAIGTATALTRLTLDGNYWLSLSMADAAVLQALPRLQRLEIKAIRGAEPALLQQLLLRSPHLRIVGSPRQLVVA